MTSITRINANHRRATATIVGDLIHCTGQCATNMDGDIRAQTTEAFAKIEALLATCGSDKTKILSVQVWISDMADYAGLNEVWDAWVSKGNEPCRACAKVEMFDPKCRVEMIVTATR